MLGLFPTVPTASPEDFTPVEVTSRSTVLTWDPPPYENQNGVIISYVIDVTVIETGETFVIISNDTLLSVTGLRPYRTYICTIAASTSIGLGPYSVSITVNTLEDGKGFMTTCLAQKCLKTRLYEWLVVTWCLALPRCLKSEGSCSQAIHQLFSVKQTRSLFSIMALGSSLTL